MLKKQQLSHPLLLLLFIETWERFSYYGMRALLVLYLVSSLGFSDPKAYSVYALFAAIGYAIPFFAGMLADRYIGFQKIIIIGATLMCVGHFLMAATDINHYFLYFGLPFIAVGTGFFKGNVTSLLGSIYENEDHYSTARDKGFSLFYVAINLGSFSASIACGYIAHKFGWHYGFGLAGVGMLIGLLAFLKYKHVLGKHGLPPIDSKHTDILKATIFALAMLICSFYMIYNSEFFSGYFSYIGIVILAIVIKIIYDCSSLERKRIALLLILTFFLLCFFALEMQLGSLINLFTERNVNRIVFGYEIPSAIFQAVNPFTILIIGPIIAQALAFLSKQSPLPRFSLGLALNILCFVSIYIGCTEAINGKAELIYLIVGVIFMGLVELFIAPLLQSLYAYLSPQKYKGLLMGLLMLSLSYANLAAVFLGKFMSIPKGSIADPIASMEIYKDGFFRILEFNFFLFIAFILLHPLLNKLLKQS